MEDIDYFADPTTTLTLITKSGRSIKLTLSITPTDFVCLWNCRSKKLTLILGKEKYVYFNKKDIAYFYVDSEVKYEGAASHL